MLCSLWVGLSTRCVLASATTPERVREMQSRGFILNRGLRPQLGMKTFNPFQFGNRQYEMFDSGPLSRTLVSRQHATGAVLDTMLSNVNTTIIGYWVGPDVEDGCGLVEAAVNRNFEF